jgi:RNA polymerase sigma factor (sigma-70 family)
VSDYAASSTAAPRRRAPAPRVPLRLLGDERLARLAAAGSERAFAVLYERHHQALYRYCRTIVRHDEDARDVLQTTMARALAALGRAVPDAPMRPWLFRIAHNEAISLLRRRRPTIDLEQAPEREAPGLEARVEERSRLTALVADLQELPDRQRSALVMRELSGFSHDDIAAALDISVSAAKQAIFDARSGLQEFAKGRAMDCADVQRIVSGRDGRMLRGRPLRAHVRSCESCRAMRDAIGARRADLAAIAPPLPAAAATGLLSEILGGGHGGGAGGLMSGAAAKVASGALGAKALAGAAVVATVAAGTTQVLPHSRVPWGREAASPAAAAAPATRTPASASAPVAGPAGTDRAWVAATAAHGTSKPPALRATSKAPAAQRHVSAGAPQAGAAATAHPGSHASPSPAAVGHGRRPAAAANASAGRRAAPSHPAGGRRPATPASHGRDRRATPASRAPGHPNRPATPAPSAGPAEPPTGAPAAGRPGGTTRAHPKPAAGASPAASAVPVAPAAVPGPAPSAPAATLSGSAAAPAAKRGG